MRIRLKWVGLLVVVSGLGFVATPLLSHSSQKGKTLFNLPDQNDKIVTGQWCHRFYHLLDTVCLSDGGNQMICKDSSLRKIVKETGGPRVICAVNHMSGVSFKQCVNGLQFDDQYCPIIKSTNKVKSGFKIYNLNKKSTINNEKVSVATAQHHTIIIGIDGVRLDAFQKAYHELRAEHQLPALMALIKKNGIDRHFFAGGLKGTATQQQTLSEPGWTSTLTGVWANQHNLGANGDTAKGKYNHQIPTLYNLMKKNIPSATTASYTDWKPIGVVASYKINAYKGADINRLYLPNDFNSISMTDRKMTNDIVRGIQRQDDPAFTYVHYTNPDDTGHVYGFSANSKAYMSALKNELVNANTLIKTIDKKSQPWLVIITTDHGGHNTIHGTQLPVDRQVFAVIGATHGGKRFSSEHKLGQTAFTPIVLQYERTGSLRNWQHEVLAV